VGSILIIFTYYFQKGNEIFLGNQKPITSQIENISHQKFEFIKGSSWMQKSSAKNLQTKILVNSMVLEKGQEKKIIKFTLSGREFRNLCIISSTGLINL